MEVTENKDYTVKEYDLRENAEIVHLAMNAAKSLDSTELKMWFEKKLLGTNQPEIYDFTKKVLDKYYDNSKLEAVKMIRDTYKITFTKAKEIVNGFADKSYYPISKALKIFEELDITFKLRIKEAKKWWDNLSDYSKSKITKTIFLTDMPELSDTDKLRAYESKDGYGF